MRFSAVLYRCGRKSARDVFHFAADVPRQTAAIRLEGIDLIYVNGPRLLTAAALAAKGRVPVLFHAHHRVEQGIARYLEGWALRRSQAIIGAWCYAVGQSLRNSVPPERIHVVPNGTADLGFRDRSFDGGRIGVIGRIAPEKGQVEFLRAAAGIPSARFVNCGAPLFGDCSYYDSVLRLASGLPVEFIDWQNDVSEIMRDLDLLVIPSKQEAMPRVVLEAFSAGLPVVAFPVGGIPEVIEEGVTGFLARDLTADLRRILNFDPQTLRGVARNARREWERLYTVAMYRRQITDLMARCVPRAALETEAPPRSKSAPRPSAPADIRSV